MNSPLPNRRQLVNAGGRERQTFKPPSRAGPSACEDARPAAAHAFEGGFCERRVDVHRLNDERRCAQFSNESKPQQYTAVNTRLRERVVHRTELTTLFMASVGDAERKSHLLFSNLKR